MKLLGSSGSLYDQCDRIFKYKVSQMFPKVVQKVATAVFTKKWILLLKSKKVTLGSTIWPLSKDYLSRWTLKNRPIWSHWTSDCCHLTKIYIKIIFPECKCSEIGSSKSDCNPESGKCDCKTGFSGQKCQVCPDGTLTNVTGCASGKKTLEICVVPKSHWNFYTYWPNLKTIIRIDQTVVLTENVTLMISIKCMIFYNPLHPL